MLGAIALAGTFAARPAAQYQSVAQYQWNLPPRVAAPRVLFSAPEALRARCAMERSMEIADLRHLLRRLAFAAACRGGDHPSYWWFRRVRARMR